MQEEYEIEPYYGEDSTSTAQFPNPAQWAGEDEAWAGIAREGGKMGAQMLNPWETVKGVGHMAKGALFDYGRLTSGFGKWGKRNYDDEPSFTGDLVDLGKGMYNNPWGTMTDMVTAPGSIPGMLAPGIPKIPKGGLYNRYRTRPGAAKVRSDLKDLRIDEYTGKDTVGRYYPGEKPSVYVPKRGGSRYDTSTRRHELGHAIHHKNSPKDYNAGGFGKLDNFIDEATQNIVGDKSVSQGLVNWGTGLLSPKHYKNHGPKAAGVPLFIAGAGVLSARRGINAARTAAPGGPVFKSQHEKEEPGKFQDYTF